MATFTLLPSGRWRVQVRKKGIYRASTFDHKKDAQNFASQLEVQINTITAGGLVTPKGLTVGKVIERYRAETNTEGKTGDSPLSRMETYFAKTKPASLPLIIQEFITKRIKEDKVAGPTIAIDLSYLGSALDWGRNVKHWDVDPTVAREARRSLKHRNLKVSSRRRERIPTDKELDALFADFKKRELMVMPMEQIVKFALASAMRIGEIVKIQAEDFDAENKTIIIRDRKDPRNKDGNDQRIPLLGDAFDIVKQRVAENPTGRIFPFGRNSVSAAFSAACDRCGIEDLCFHDLRHAAITNLFKMGLTIPYVALISGHKSWENLKRYTQLDASSVFEVLGHG